MILAPATSDDVMPIANILSQWNAATPWMPRLHSRSAEKYFARMLVARGWVSVARTGPHEAARLLGFLAREKGEVHALYLSPMARGQGVGKALMDQAKSASDTLGLYTFVANKDAQRFYLREGFEESYRTDGAGNDEGLPDIRFEWSAT